MTSPTSLRRAGLTALVALSLAGCANFRRLDADLERFNQLAPLDVQVEKDNWTGRPIVIVVMQPPPQPGLPIIISTSRTLKRPGSVRVRLVPGQYMVGAYEDISGDLHLQLGKEPLALYQDMQPFSVGGEGDIADLTLTLGMEVPEVLAKIEAEGEMSDRSLATRSEGLVVPLSDPRFEPEHAQVGVWQPVTFTERFGGGVYMLQEYDPARIPVLFVHGMGGHPREFTTIIEALDARRFQPWVAYYPSGWRLDQLAQALEEILQGMQARLGFPQMYLVAHSMGGLLSRGMLSLHAKRDDTPFVARFVTLSSPLGGMASADKGVTMAPSVVPSWRDIGPKSGYVSQLYRAPKPSCTDYTLLFGYGDSSRNEASDGVVPVSSQLRLEAQREANAEAGFETTHTGILTDPRAVRYLMRALAEERPGTCACVPVDPPPATDQAPIDAATASAAAEP